MREAISLTTLLLRYQPENARALFLRGKSFAVYDDAKRAIADFESGFKIDPGAADADVFLMWSRAICQEKNLKAAMDVLDTGIRRRQDSELYAERANLKLIAHDEVGALKDMNSSIKINPNSRTVILMRAKFYQSKHQHEKAIADFTSVVNFCSKQHLIDANYSNALSDRAVSYDAIGRMDLARKDRQAHDLNGQSWAADMFK